MNVSKDLENIKLRKALFNEVKTELKEIEVSLQIIKGKISIEELTDFNDNFIRDNKIMIDVDILEENIRTLKRFLNIFRNS
jgi:FlaG/FlaF family flagellin (archaellin)|tara:strand:+ start:9744 stop:9986 length:243 start_codon:yes stop_codon:yes gene_type:complete